MIKKKTTLGRKRRFLFFGALNVILTNLLLQGLLLILPTSYATFLSQIVNVGLGFFLYGKKVFRVEHLQRKSAFYYGILAIMIWFFNWGGIEGINNLGFSRNIAALMLIPLLGSISYFTQKCLIFPNMPKTSIFKN